MSLETFLGLACLVGAAICFAVARYCERNVKVTYKEQRVWGDRK